MQEKLYIYLEISLNIYYNNNLELSLSPLTSDPYIVSPAEYKKSKRPFYNISRPKTLEYKKSKYAKDNTAVLSRPLH
jgi:hypothetical protein